MSVETQGLQLRTLIKRSGELELSLVDVPTPEPGPDEVVVRIEAAPINPSDLGLLVGAADLSTLQASGTKARPVITAKVPEAGMRAMAGRLDESLPIGNEGAGTVVKTGSSEAAKALMPEIELADDAYAAAEGADAVAIVTEWDIFRALDLKRLVRIMAAPVMVDLRNIYTLGEAERAGFR